MTHLANKNPFKNQGLAILVASVASFGKRFGKKKSFKIKEMPRMAQIVRLNGGCGKRGRGPGKLAEKRECN